MKKIIMCLLLLTVSFSFVSCKSREEKKEEKRILELKQQQKESFEQWIKEGKETEGRKMGSGKD